jgi:predicted MFS family arabinose efflux permease
MTHAVTTGTGDVPARTEVDLAQDRLPRPVVATGFVILALSYMINAMDRQVFFPLLPEIRQEYGFNLPEGGLLATGFTLGMALAGLPAGYLVDRFTRKTVLVLSIVVYSLGTLATPLASGWADMATYRVVGLYQVTLLSLVAVVAVAFVRPSQFNNAARTSAD